MGGNWKSQRALLIDSLLFLLIPPMWLWSYSLYFTLDFFLLTGFPGSRLQRSPSGNWRSSSLQTCLLVLGSSVDNLWSDLPPLGRCTVLGRGVGAHWLYLSLFHLLYEAKKNLLTHYSWLYQFLYVRWGNPEIFRSIGPSWKVLGPKM